jgi:hypothetical protein
MQERGITTTAVIIYVIIATIVIATFSVITTDFYETLKKENKQSMYSNKYTEFMSYFAKDVQEKNNAVDTAGVSNSDKGEQIPYITFTNGNTYKFSNENSTIYKNDIKICDNINICVFKKENYNTKKDKITVNFKAGDFSKIGDNALVFYMNK